MAAPSSKRSKRTARRVIGKPDAVSLQPDRAPMEPDVRRQQGRHGRRATDRRIQERAWGTLLSGHLSRTLRTRARHLVRYQTQLPPLYRIVFCGWRRAWLPAFIAELTPRGAWQLFVPRQSRLAAAVLVAALVLAPTVVHADAGPAPDDAEHAFDFDIGTWKTHSTRLLHPLAGSTEWIQMDGVTVVRPVWGGKGNIAELEADGPKGHLQLLSLRLYDPARINGISTSPPAGSAYST